MRYGAVTICLLAFGLCCAACDALAAAPEVRALFPAGGQRGTTVEVSAGGKFDTWPVQFWVDRPGLTISPGDKGKFSVAIAGDAAPGRYWIRLYDPTGTSAPQPFVVGTLAEMLEAESNNAPQKAQAAPSSTVVVNGKLGGGGDLDSFSVPLTRGQTLVASLAAHETLGSPMDAVLHVTSADGRQLAYNHDRRGLDPEIVFAAPADANFLARVFAFPSQPNSSIAYSGGDQYVYRLTLTTAGFVDYPWPLAVTRDRATPVDLIGWNLPESLRTVQVQSAGETHDIADPALANVVSVSVEPHETQIEAEPNDRQSPKQVTLPLTVSGRIDVGGDEDAFVFQGKAGQALVLELESRSLGYPLDGVLQVFDAADKSLARADDVGAGRDPQLAFTPPADGAFRLVVTDLNQAGSSRHVYRLRMVPATPAYEVTADALAYTIPPDKPTDVTLTIDRQHGFADPIDFTVEGLPELVTASAARSEPTGDSAKSVKLTLTSNGGTFAGPIRIRAKSAGATPLERMAAAAIPNHTVRLAELWLTVPPPAEPAAK